MAEQKLKQVRHQPGITKIRRTRKDPEPAAVTVAVINHDGMAVLPETMAALHGVDDPPLSICLLDDASSDGGVDWVERRHPDVEVVRLPPPGGRPSRLRNRALRDAGTPYVLLLDNDVTLEPGCVSRLLKEMRDGARESGGRMLAATPTLVSAADPETIYRQGNEIHFLGIATDSSLGRPRSPEDDAAPPIPTIPGGNALVNREAALELGLFDEAYDFGWGEDSELYARGAWEGWTSVAVPAAVARHVERPKGVTRAEAQLYNRCRFIATHYSARSLVLLAPPLLLFEPALAAMSLAKGVFPAYVRALRRVVRDRKEILARRRSLQSRSRRSDAAVLVGTDFIPAGMFARSKVFRTSCAMANRLFGAWWTLVRRWL